MEHQRFRETPSGWTVLDEKLGVLVRRYVIDVAPGYANSFAVRIGEGKMLIASPCVALTDDVLRDLSTFGEPAAIVAENGFHYLGLPEWHRRFPQVPVFAPTLAAQRIEGRFEDLPTFRPITDLRAMLPDHVHVGDVPGTKTGQAWISVLTEGGHVLFASDTFGNMDEMPNVALSLVFRLMRSYPGLRMNRVAARLMLRDRGAAKSFMLEELERRPPTILVPSHGPFVLRDGVAEHCRRELLAAL